MKISGVMPIRNGQNWLPFKIDEIMMTLQNSDELIVIDDNSKDETRRLLLKLSRTYDNLTVLENPRQGIVSALNFGIKQSTNEIIFRYDIDDQYVQGRKELQLAEISKGSGLVFADYAIWGKGKTFLGVIPTAIRNDESSLSLLRARRTPHPIACFSKSLFDDVGGYLEEDSPAEDHGLWIRMSKRTNISSVPNVLLNYNLNPHSVSFSNFSRIKEKTYEINSSWKVDAEYKNGLLDSLAEYSEICAQTNFGDERLLLHYSDLLHPQFLSQLSKNEQKFIKSLVKSKTFNFSNLKTGSRISFEIAKRKIYRRLNSL